MLFSILQGNMSFEAVVVQVLALLTVIIFVLPFHEWAHAFVALKLGDESVRYSNRLSFNPANHIDPMGAAFLLLFGFGWAKPVPINSNNFKNPKKGMAITAAAGPIANIVASIAVGLIYYAILAFIPFSNVLFYILMFLKYIISVNLFLAVFNLLPVPPLDGSKILFGFLPDKIAYKAYAYERYLYILLLILLMTGLLSAPLGWVTGKLESFVHFITRLPFSFFLK